MGRENLRGRASFCFDTCNQNLLARASAALVLTHCILENTSAAMFTPGSNATASSVSSSSRMMLRARLLNQSNIVCGPGARLHLSEAFGSF